MKGWKTYRMLYGSGFFRRGIPVRISVYESVETTGRPQQNEVFSCFTWTYAKLLRTLSAWQYIQCTRTSLKRTAQTRISEPQVILPLGLVVSSFISLKVAGNFSRFVFQNKSIRRLPYPIIFTPLIRKYFYALHCINVVGILELSYVMFLCLFDAY